MGATDRGAELMERTQKLLQQLTIKQDYGYDIGPATVPTPQGVKAGYLLIITARSPVLSPPRLAWSHFIADPWPADDMITAAIQVCLKGIAETRRKLLEVPK
jgi:hypothetical protein